LDEQRSKDFFRMREGIERIRARGMKGTGQMSHGLDCGMNGGTETSTLGSSWK
jgi:hypothetical protein